MTQSPEPSHDAEQAFNQVAETVAKIDDPVERARVAGAALKAIPTLQSALRRTRQAAVLELRSADHSHQDVANLLGVSRSAAQQIAEGKTGSRKPKRTVDGQE